MSSLRHHQVGGVQRGQLEAVAVGDGVVGQASTQYPQKDAAVVIDVINLAKRSEDEMRCSAVFSAASM